MFGLLARLASLALLLAVLAVPAEADKRVALVIGNAQYAHTSPLKNPRNDATAVAAALRELGFEVIEGLDQKQVEMQQAIAEFAGKLETADVGLLYYAGHGLQVDGRNYLVPIDARLRTELELQFQTVPTDLLLNVMESRNRVSILLLDACRDNPLAEQLSRSMGTRSSSLGRGLAKIETGIGTYIVFSTQPGNIALDGDGQNSPFAEALINAIGKPGIDIELMMREVRAEVIDKTKGYQVPWGNSSLVGGFMFSRPEVAVAEPQPQKVEDPAPKRDSEAVDPNLEIVFWNSIKDSNDPALFEAYIERFPNGVFVPIASVLLRRSQAEAKVDDAARQKAEEVARLEAEHQAAEEARRKAEETARVEAERQAEEARKTAEEIARLEAERQAAEEARRKAEEKLAMLNPQADTPGDDQSSVAAPDRDFVRAVQQELNRLGCTVGKADGHWGNASRKALEQYARRVDTKLAALEPSPQLLDALRARTARVCPLVCGKGQVDKGGECIAAPVPRKEKKQKQEKPVAEASRSEQPEISDKVCMVCLPPGVNPEFLGGFGGDRSIKKVLYCGKTLVAKKRQGFVCS